MKKTILALSLATSSAFAINLGVVGLFPEVGATISYAKIGLTPSAQELKSGLKADGSQLNFGGYGRLWLEVLGIMITPQVKYDRLPSIEKSNKKINNIQYGGLLGYRIPIIGLTPFVGANYSTFSGGEAKLKNTYALNAGLRWEVPFIPLLTLGVEGNWQKPSTAKDSKIDIVNISGTIGLSF